MSRKPGVLAPNGTRPNRDWKVEPLKHVKYETDKLDGRVALIMLSRPENRNAWTEIMRNEIIYCIHEANRDKNIKVIVIAGDPSGRAFCFGADLSPLSDSNPSSIEGDVPLGRKANLMYWRDGGGQAGLAIVNSLKPVICAMNGTGVGVGATLPTCCDITIGARGSKIGYVFGKRGLAMECISSYFLSRCVGHKVAMELVLTGRIMKTEDAPPGIFNHLVPLDQVIPKALEIAEEICTTSSISSMFNRHMIIRNGYGTSPEEAHLVESKAIFTSLGHSDYKEGKKSFLEKRDADFKMDPFKDSPSWFPWWKGISVISKL